MCLYVQPMPVISGCILVILPPPIARGRHVSRRVHTKTLFECNTSFLLTLHIWQLAHRGVGKEDGGTFGLTTAQMLLARFGRKRLQALKVPGGKLMSCVTL